MAEKKEDPVVDNETGKIKVKAKAKKEKQPDGNETKGNVTKVKTTMTSKPEVIEKTVTKVDLTKPTKPEENETKKDNADDSGMVTELDNAKSTEKQEEVQPKTETQETPVLEEIKEESNVEVEETAKEATEAITESEKTGEPLPENIQKLVEFMQETGGDINDYVTLNQDYSELDNHALLKEYYKSTKPHLSEEEVEFVMEDTFAYDEDENTDKEIKRKKLAMKEQVAQARQHLESVKSKYYEDIKAGSKLTEEQQKAVEFFNRYNDEYEQSSSFGKKQSEVFSNKSNNVFNDKFKGFEYKVGEKKFRFNIKDTDKIKESQSDINNFIKKFLTKDNLMDDAAGYHKGLFTAMNPDQIANHFYEQGKADALKDSIAKSKNVSMDPRQAHGENVNTSGFTARALNNDSSNFKFKIKNNKFKK